MLITNPDNTLLFNDSEFNLFRYGITPELLRNNPFESIGHYLKFYSNQRGGYCWGGYAFLDYPDEKRGCNSAVQFSAAEKAFLAEMKKRNHNFSNDCLDVAPGYPTYVFDACDMAYVFKDAGKRVVVDGDPEGLPKQGEGWKYEECEGFQLPEFINALDYDQPECGFYACYRNLDLLYYFKNLNPNGEFVKYISDSEQYEKAQRLNAKKFIDQEILAKFEKNLGPVDSLDFILVHHCHSLAMLLTSKSSTWEVYQNLHVIGFNQERCMSYGFYLID